MRHEHGQQAVTAAAHERDRFIGQVDDACPGRVDIELGGVHGAMMTAMSETETIRSEADGPVLVVTIDRPEVRNAVDGPTAAALADAFRAFADDDDLSVAILTGAGG